jgi:6-phosphogluconolactonase (cycloisomerase 2 family)
MKPIIALVFSIFLCVACTPEAGSLYLLVGAYSDGTTPGISVYTFDTNTGHCRYVGEYKELLNPSYLVISPDEQFVYSVNETAEGAVSAFRFDQMSGTLHLLNSQSTGGADPCYINMDNDQTFVVTANYSGGSISVFPVAGNGSLKPLSGHWDMRLLMNVADSSAVSHIHTAVFSPGEPYLFVTDLGLDMIYRFSVDAKDSSCLVFDDAYTTAVDTGSGPRHLAFHPNRNYLYGINELSGTVTTFLYDRGELSAIQNIISDTTSGVGGKGSADIHISPDGNFLYASNRLKADGIAIFSINPANGKLARIAYQATGIHPRNFILTPDGNFLLCANRDSNTVQIFRRDAKTGLLHDTGKVIPVDKPVCLQFCERKFY